MRDFSSNELSNDLYIVNTSIEKWILSSSFTVVNNNSFTLSIGKDVMDLYVEWGHTGNTTRGDYTRIEVNELIIKLIAACIIYAPEVSVPSLGGLATTTRSYAH